MNTTPARRPRGATLLAGALGLALAGGLLVGCATGATSAQESPTVSAEPSGSSSTASGSAASGPAAPSDAAERLSYAGRDGATALELLLEEDPTAEVTGTGENAFVTAVGGRVADDSTSEFWALSVDGEPAQVGAGALETTDGQEITWTLETY